MTSLKRKIAILLAAVMVLMPTMASLADTCAPKEHVYQPVKDENEGSIYYECEICDATASNAEYDEYCGSTVLDKEKEDSEESDQSQMDLKAFLGMNLLMMNQTPEIVSNVTTELELDEALRFADGTEEEPFVITIEESFATTKNLDLNNIRLIVDGTILTLGGKINISGNSYIEGGANGGTLIRDGSFTGMLIEVPADASLEINNMVIDGGAEWGTEYDADYDEDEEMVNVLGYSLQNSGVTNCDMMIYVNNDAELSMYECILQNNDRQVEFLYETGTGDYPDNPAPAAIKTLGNTIIEDTVITRCVGGTGAMVITGNGLCELVDTKITKNAGMTVKSQRAYVAGGVKINKTAHLKDCEISSNVSRFGAGLWIKSSNVKGTLIEDTDIINNYCFGPGAGIAGEWSNSPASTGIVFERCTVADNRTNQKWNHPSTGHELYAAGVDLSHDIVDFIDCTISNNTSLNAEKGATDIFDHEYSNIRISGNTIIGKDGTGGVGIAERGHTGNLIVTGPLSENSKIYVCKRSCRNCSG